MGRIKHKKPKYHHWSCDDGPEVCNNTDRKPMFTPKKPNNVFDVNKNPIEQFEQAKVRRLLYPHQVDAMRSVSNYFEAGNRIAVVSIPTGAGKSGIAICMAYLLGAKNVLVITPSLITMKQMHTSFCGASKDHAKAFVIKQGLWHSQDANDVLPPYPNTEATSTKMIADLLGEDKKFHQTQTLLVVNAQKFGGAARNVRLKDIQPDFFDFIIVDEAHHYPAATWTGIIAHFNAPSVLFITATPNIKANLSVCYTLTLEAAIQSDIIRRTKFEELEVLSVPLGADVDALVQIPVIKRIIEILLSGDSDQKAMVLALGIDQAAGIAAAFNQITGETDYAHTYVSADGDDVLKDFTRETKHHNYRVLVVCGRPLEGFDDANVTTLGILRNIGPNSKTLFTQFVGRAIRKRNPQDYITATIVTSIACGQRANYDAYVAPVHADDDPDEETGQGHEI